MFKYDYVFLKKRKIDMKSKIINKTKNKYKSCISYSCIGKKFQVNNKAEIRKCMQNENVREQSCKQSKSRQQKFYDIPLFIYKSLVI